MLLERYKSRLFKEIIVSYRKCYIFILQINLVENERLEIRTFMKYEFLSGTTSSQTARNINSVFGSGVTPQLELFHHSHYTTDLAPIDYRNLDLFYLI